MKKMFYEIFCFCLPVIPFCLFIVCVDPHNYFNITKFISDETKITSFMRSPEAMPRGDMLWNMLRFKRNPCPNVIIGNSQGFLFREKLISEQTGEQYYNFCVPGITLRTSVNTFWYIVNQTKPKKIVIQVSFTISNSNYTQADNLFKSSQDYLSKPYLYFFNKDILFDSYYNVKYEIEKKRGWPGQDEVLTTVNGRDSSDELWLHNLFKNYTYPEKEMLEFKKMSEYCKENNIELEFVLLPFYSRCQEYILEKGLDKMENRFKADLRDFGKVYDYTSQEAISKYEYNFSDYFHSTQRVTDSLTLLIWQQKKDSSLDSIK